MFLRRLESGQNRVPQVHSTQTCSACFYAYPLYVLIVPTILYMKQNRYPLMHIVLQKLLLPPTDTTLGAWPALRASPKTRFRASVLQDLDLTMH